MIDYDRWKTTEPEDREEDYEADADRAYEEYKDSDCFDQQSS